MEIIKLPLIWRAPLKPITQKIEKLIAHHMANDWTIQRNHEYHQKGRGWNGLGYNYWISFDGKIYEGRGRNVGAQAGASWNGRSLGVGFQGNFEVQDMTDAQLQSGIWLFAKLAREEGLTAADIQGHSATSATACPGKNFRMAELKAGVEKVLRGDIVLQRGDKGPEVAEWQSRLVALGYNLGTYGKAKDGVDGSFGPATEAAVEKFQRDSGLPVNGVLDVSNMIAIAVKVEVVEKDKIIKACNEDIELYRRSFKLIGTEATKYY